VQALDRKRLASGLFAIENVGFFICKFDFRLAFNRQLGVVTGRCQVGFFLYLCVCVVFFAWYFFDETVMLVFSCVPFKQDDGVGAGIICMVVTSLELYNE